MSNRQSNCANREYEHECYGRVEEHLVVSNLTRFSLLLLNDFNRPEGKFSLHNGESSYAFAF